jgi:hypothetical protein
MGLLRDRGLDVVFVSIANFIFNVVVMMNLRGRRRGGGELSHVSVTRWTEIKLRREKEGEGD